jgi:sugar-phosphatase
LNSSVIVRIPRDGAVIFDLDGTLVDSTEVVERQWKRWAREHGVNEEALMEVVHGRPSIQTMQMLVPETTLEESRAFDAIEAADLAGVKPAPGAERILEQCKAESIPWAIVTSGTLPMATNRLKACGLPIPQVFVTVEQTAHGKPAPDPFLRAATLLKVAPSVCSAFEDSPPGVDSAKAAGMRVIAVQTTHRLDQLSGADAIVGDLSEVEIQRL